MINLSLFKNNKFESSWSLALGPREIQEINEITSETPNDPIYVINDYLGAKIGHLARHKFESSWSLALGPREIQEINEITSETPNDPIYVINDYLGAKIGHLARQIKDN